MPVHRSIPDDNYTALPHSELKNETIFLPGPVKVTVQNGSGARAEALLIGWVGEDAEHVFLSPDGFACTTPEWTVQDVWCP